MTVGSNGQHEINQEGNKPKRSIGLQLEESKPTQMETNQYPTILVLGASGTIGRQVVKALQGKAVNVRITSRKQEVVEQICSEWMQVP
jgi:glutamyl-tRNA reductase